MELLEHQKPKIKPKKNTSPETDPIEETTASLDQPDFEAIEADLNGEIIVEGELPESQPGLLSRDQFFAAFKSIFAIGGAVPVPPFPLKSMPIQPHEEDAAREASNAIYDIALESPWLRFLIEPSSVWMQRLIVISTFGGLKLMAIRDEIRAKSAKEINPKQSKEKSEPVEKPTPENQPIDLPDFLGAA